MEKIIFAILVILFLGILWCLPLYIIVNLILWAFHISYHLTIIQAFLICILLSLIGNMLFKNDTEGGK